jgi:hypothetical protein
MGLVSIKCPPPALELLVGGIAELCERRTDPRDSSYLRAKRSRMTGCGFVFITAQMQMAVLWMASIRSEPAHQMTCEGVQSRAVCASG